MTTKIVLITGANTGLGLAFSRYAVSDNTKIIMAVRSVFKAQAAINGLDISEELKDRMIPMECNLGNKNSILEFSKKLHEEYKEGINVIINNAGIYAKGCNNRMETDNGHEIHFGTNHIGHFTLTLLILDLLRKGAMYSNTDSKIITVASELYKKSNIDFNNLQLKTGYNTDLAYANSKLANILFTQMLCEKLEHDRTGPGAGRLKAYTVHPGIVYTSLSRYYTTNIVTKFFWWLASKIILRTPSQGIEPYKFVYTTPTNELTNGGYYGNGLIGCGNQPIPSDDSLLPMAKDTNMAEKLWQVSENISGVKLNSDCNITIEGPTDAMMF